MRQIEIRWGRDGWCCDINEDGKHRYRQLAPSELGAGDAARVLQWAADLWPDAAFELDETGESR
jgi:hypothetical protein